MKVHEVFELRVLGKAPLELPSLEAIQDYVDGHPEIDPHITVVKIWQGRGCKPEPRKIPSSQFQSCHERIQVDHLSVAPEGVMPV